MEGITGCSVTMPDGETCKPLQVTEQMYFRYRNQYGGLTVDDVKRLNEIERESQQLKGIVADQALDIDILHELHRVISEPDSASSRDESHDG